MSAPIEIGTYTCKRCGKQFQHPVRGMFIDQNGKPGVPCRQCMEEINHLSKVLHELQNQPQNKTVQEQTALVIKRIEKR